MKIYYCISTSHNDCQVSEDVDSFRKYNPFRINWSITVRANSPSQAKRKALKLMRDF